MPSFYYKGAKMHLRHMSIDIETFSSVDIKKSGLYKYVQSPDFEILLFAYSFDGGEVQIVDLARGEGLPPAVQRALSYPNIVKHAYNAAFEWYCLSKFYHTPIEQWRCTMLHGLYCGYTIGLGATATALGLPEDKKKMGVGMSLIRTFCCPVKPTNVNGQRTRLYPIHEPEKWELFKKYCIQDVITEMEVENRLSNFPVPEQEQKLWVLDQLINADGVMVDAKLVEGALSCSEISTQELMKEAILISGLENPKSVQQLKKWLEAETGEEVESLNKENVKGMIKASDDSSVIRMLEIRQELAKTSVKKYLAMNNAVCFDGRVRGLLQFYGANRTGRWAGRLVQIHNLPKNYLQTLSHARDCVKGKKLDALKIVYGNIPDTLSQLIRTTFIPREGHTFVVADFSAIEARVIAWLAGEQWRLDVFATHGKIYEASASQMFGVPVEKIVKGNPEYSLRQKGKVAELALGYQGSSGALIKMGALGMGLTEDELPEIVGRWRNTNKRIVDLWHSIENAVIEVVETGRAVGIRGLIIARESCYEKGQDFLTITLPSGRKLFYAKPTLQQNKFGRNAMHYYGINQETKKWGVDSTYGGKLTENIVQAIARDCLAESLVRLNTAGYRIVFHVHDEVIIEVPKDKANVNEVCEIMGIPISWAPGLKLKAEGFVTDYYMKEG